MTESRAFRVEVTVHAPREDVWRALTDRAEVRRWFGWDYDGLEEEIEFIFFEHATPHPPDRIELEDGEGGQTIELVDQGARTLVRVVKPGDLGEVDWDQVYEDMIEGWRAFFGQLDHYLARHDGQERRTLHLTGEAAPSAVLAVLEGDVVRLSRFVVLADGGEALVTVESAGDLDTSEPARVRVTVGAYGLADEAFARLRERWEQRWRELAQGAEVVAQGSRPASR